MYRIGLTGGIATGKSRVLASLAGCGLHTIDLDRVAHRVMEPGRPAHGEILATFGASVARPDGTIDRRALGALVFRDDDSRARLNAIVHPRVFEEEERLVAALEGTGSPAVVTDATLLVESGHHVRFDRLLATRCDPGEQIRRLMQRDGLAVVEAEARVAAQMPTAEKVKYAHEVIDTGGSPDETDATARGVGARLLAVAAGWPGPAPVPLHRALGCLADGPQVGPRGLRPVAVAQQIAAAGVPDLTALAGALLPPHEGPWYTAGRYEVAGPGPETLMGPVVLWSRAWHGPDVDSLLGVAVSVARLTHSSPHALAEAAGFAVALGEVAAAGSLPADLTDRVRGQALLIQRWAGAPPSPSLLARVGAAGGASGPQDATGAALIGLARGAQGAPPETVAAARGLAALRRTPLARNPSAHDGTC